MKESNIVLTRQCMYAVPVVARSIYTFPYRLTACQAPFFNVLWPVRPKNDSKKLSLMNSLIRRFVGQ